MGSSSHPAAMKRATAAAYCDLTVPAFEREVAAGRLPQPIMLGGTLHWRQAAIDAALAGLAGEGPANDWRAGTKLYAQA